MRVKPHMREALKDHVLELKLKQDGKGQFPIEVWRMHRPDSSMYAVQLTFTGWGIAVQGDIGFGANQHGVCSSAGYGVEWFAQQREYDLEYICEKFFRCEYQPRLVLEEVLQAAREEQDKEWKKRLFDLHNELEIYEGEERLIHAKEETEDHPSFEPSGYDYPLAQAGWLCAVQQRFAVLYKQHKERECQSDSG